MGDFKVDTNGQCFLCMGKLDSSPEVFSLQHLSRYLKINMKKVFDEQVVVPPELLAKVEKARLKVELCEDCVVLNRKFSKLYRQLEKIEMEMASQLNKIHIKLLKANHYLGTDPGGSLNGRHKIAEALRSEAKQKCFHKITAAGDTPRIKIRKLTLKQARTERHKIKFNFLIGQRGLKTTVSKYSSDGIKLETIEGGIEQEYPPRGSDLDMEHDDIGNDYFDDHPDPRSSSPPCSAELTTCKSATSVGGDAEVKKCSAGDDDSMAASNYKLEAGVYKCTVCSKKFRAKSKWKRHYENIHLKIRYKCNLCDKEFVQRGNYQRHHRSVHIGVKFKCLICNKLFTEKYLLTSHQRKGDCNRESTSKI